MSFETRRFSNLLYIKFGQSVCLCIGRLVEYRVLLRSTRNLARIEFLSVYVFPRRFFLGMSRETVSVRGSVCEVQLSCCSLYGRVMCSDRGSRVGVRVRPSSVDVCVGGSGVGLVVGLV